MQRPALMVFFRKKLSKKTLILSDSTLCINKGAIFYQFNFECIYMNKFIVSFLSNTQFLHAAYFIAKETVK